MTRIEAVVPTATMEEVLAADSALVLDLRSPAEFAEDHIPGARNVPLFDDVQRALIGTLYKQDSPEAAFREGRDIARERIGALVEQIARASAWDVGDADLERRVERMTAGGIERMSDELRPVPCSAMPERPVVLHCWRGGLRSRSVVAFVRALGLTRAVGLGGGYKSWRRYAMERIETWRAPPAFVLRGLTGVGKTLVLRAIESLRPGWTLDLEELAAHRSSLLGMVGLRPCSQRAFESGLAHRIARGFPGPVVFEGESRKVGDVTVPAGVWSALCAGTDIELVAPTACRVQVLAGDYLATDASRSELREQLPLVEGRMKKAVAAGTLVGLLDRNEIPALVELLLECYYDPLYRHSEARHQRDGKAYATTIDASDADDAAQRVVEWIEKAMRKTA